MVARATGDAQLSDGGASVPARGAQLLEPPVRATLGRGGELVLVYVSDGHQELLKGPGEFEIQDAQARLIKGNGAGKVERGKAVSRRGIAIKGRNLNRVGGGRQRATTRYQWPEDVPIRAVTMKAQATQGIVEVSFQGRGPGTFWLWAGADPIIEEPGIPLSNEGTEPEDWVTYYGRVPLLENENQQLTLRLSWLDTKEQIEYHDCRFRILSSEDQTLMNNSLSMAKAVESPLARHLLSMVIYDDFDQLGRAISHGRKALKLNPDDENIHADLARLLIDAGRIREAREHHKFSEEPLHRR